MHRAVVALIHTFRNRRRWLPIATVAEYSFARHYRRAESLDVEALLRCQQVVACVAVRASSISVATRR